MDRKYPTLNFEEIHGGAQLWQCHAQLKKGSCFGCLFTNCAVRKNFLKELKEKYGVDFTKYEKKITP